MYEVVLSKDAKDCLLRKIILTHGFLKKDNAIPEREIARAERFHHDYLAQNQ